MAQYASSRGASASFRIHRMAGGNDVGDSVILSQEFRVFWSSRVWGRRLVCTRGGMHRRRCDPGVRGRGWFRLDSLAERNTIVHGRRVLHVWSRPIICP